MRITQPLPVVIDLAVPHPEGGWDAEFPPVVLARREGRLLTFWCEWCSRRHLHGGTGHRTAHCTNPASPYLRTGYYVREVAS